MNAILEMLHNNEPLTTQLRAATSAEDATELLLSAAQESGRSVTASEISALLAGRPTSDPEALSDEELQTVSGGLPPITIETKLSACSQICCYTCRTSAIVW